LQVSDFYYELPAELIAQEPLPERSASRMLVISREKQMFHDDVFANFSRYLRPGDCLVLNNTRVFPARLQGRRDTKGGASIEVFLVHAVGGDLWKALVKPAKRVRKGDRIFFTEDFFADVIDEGSFGERTILLSARESIVDLLEKFGRTPLPPYIRREPLARDRERYQTVFAQKCGSVAAPTAGLHFTPEILRACVDVGVSIAYVTLHVGLGTFAPLREKSVEKVRLHEEFFEIGPEAAALMRKAKRLFCVGTTSVRTIETAMLRGGLMPIQGQTDLFIYPGFRYRATGAMLTNFHLPESSLLMLVSAFAGRELTLAAYRHAVAQRYRFFSYGDCMLVE
jgi:S-adenosylmethionine:tRNA ribosyltransferase-isomerase